MYSASGKDGKFYAIKVFFFEKFCSDAKKANEEAKHERKTIEGLNHKHLVNFVKFCDKSVITMNDGEKRNCCYNVYELMSRGSLEENLKRRGPFNEEICRFYFKQIILGLTYFHDKGYAHRDVKPGNLLFDSEYTMKLGDFGIASRLEGKDFLVKDSWGTQGFMAPECYEGEPYNGVEADLFASAIVLFKMCTGYIPFVTLDPRDNHPRTSLLQKGDFEEILNSFEKRDKFPKLSSDLKDLLKQLLMWDVKDRIKFIDVLDHKWFKGKTTNRHDAV